MYTCLKKSKNDVRNTLPSFGENYVIWFKYVNKFPFLVNYSLLIRSNLFTDDEVNWEFLTVYENYNFTFRQEDFSILALLSLSTLNKNLKHKESKKLPHIIMIFLWRYEEFFFYQYGHLIRNWASLSGKKNFCKYIESVIFL